MHKKILFVLLVATFTYQVSGDLPCSPRKYNHSSVVCVCNATYCDEVDKVEKQPEGNYVLYVSSQDGLRFHRTDGKLSKKKNRPPRQSNWFASVISSIQSLRRKDVILNINRTAIYQSIIGFGGAFTDAVGINYEPLSNETKEKFINSYFSSKGLEYNLGRVPIGGCDFSTYPYAYNMNPENDVKLSNFSLSEEDYNYKIPLIKEAQKVAEEEILLLGAAWSPPVWMKTNKKYGGQSRLLPKYYQTWADYHLKFLEQYDDNGISFWAISTGNEPINGIFPVMGFNSLGWLPEQQGKWVAENLGPTIKGSKFNKTLILALDDQRFSLPKWIDIMAENNETMQYIDGIAVHWYWDDLFPVSFIDNTHNHFPDKFILATEACVGDKPWQTEKVELGSWSRAEKYVQDIVEDLNHWVTGWVDWNLILDRQGGPNWFNNFVDSPIISLPDDDEFIKQPLFYAMGHFSKFIPRGSKRILVDSVPESNSNNVAFLRPDGGVTVVYYNTNDFEQQVTIQEKGKGQTILNIRPKSFSTLVYW